MPLPLGTSYEYVSGVFHVNDPQTAEWTEMKVFFWNRGDSEATVSARLYRFNNFLNEIGPYTLAAGEIWGEGWVYDVESPGFNDPSPYYWARLFASSAEVVPSMRFNTPTDFWVLRLRPTHPCSSSGFNRATLRCSSSRHLWGRQSARPSRSWLVLPNVASEA